MPRIALVLACLAALALAAAPAAAGGPGLGRTERAVVRLLNDVRAQHGLPALHPARGLSRAADRHTRDMLRADFFDHASSDGTPFHRRVRRFARAGTVGETIGRLGRRRGGAGTVVRLWMDSPSHRAIVLAPEFRRVGVGRRWGSLGNSGQAVFTADFAD